MEGGDGALFSRFFYERFTAEHEGEDEGVVDLARACQGACVEMMRTRGKEALSLGFFCVARVLDVSVLQLRSAAFRRIF